MHPFGPRLVPRGAAVAGAAELLTDPLTRPAARHLNNRVFAIATGLYLIVNTVAIALTVSF
ncbi:hypothetical protein ACWDFH_25050 [Streptomyces kronopolitis]|uniref:hypothetical protein n=1 Tax=Streptomyces kronopolitis TaxID=1612435 RepID=UPI0036CADA67